jgi:FkbM family methyltransferase
MPEQAAVLSDPKRQQVDAELVAKPLSYAQNMEDYHLSLAFAGRTHGTYVDIGGGHPIADSVSFWFYERGWQGLVVEPQEALANLHRRLRPRDILVEAAVGKSPGEVEFHRVERLHALSTTVTEHAHAAAGYGARVSTSRVPCVSLADLCTEHGLSTVDFLKIDVEGGERDVIAGADWRRFRPAVVVVEAVKPLTGEPAWQNWEPLLTSSGYRIALFDTLNRFYVAEECQALFAKFPKERASWDRVQHMYEIGRAPDSPQHPDHLLAAELAHGFWASLPHLPAELIVSLLRRARGEGNTVNEELDRLCDDEAFRLSLGRIACGYDGGQLVDETIAPAATG